MTITIEATAEAVFEFLQTLPRDEFDRVRAMLLDSDGRADESTEWSEDDFRDLSSSTAQLIDKRFGPELGNYD